MILFRTITGGDGYFVLEGNTYTHTYTHTYTRAYIHTYTHANTYAHTYTHTYAHTYAHTQTHIYALTYTHTHTHTKPLYVQIDRLIWIRRSYFLSRDRTGESREFAIEAVHRRYV